MQTCGRILSLNPCLCYLVQRLFDQVSRGWRRARVPAGGDDLSERKSRHLSAPATRGPIFAPAEVVELDLVGHLHRRSHIHKLNRLSINSVPL